MKAEDQAATIGDAKVGAGLLSIREFIGRCPHFFVVVLIVTNLTSSFTAGLSRPRFLTSHLKRPQPLNVVFTGFNRVEIQSVTLLEFSTLLVN